MFRNVKNLKANIVLGPSDVRPEKFEEINFQKHILKSQMRVLAGQDYIKYIYNILNETQNSINSFGNYELFIFDNIDEMHKKIHEKDKEFGLCRMIAGYAWPWNSKKDSTNYDIIINNSKFYTRFIKTYEYQVPFPYLYLYFI